MSDAAPNNPDKPPAPLPLRPLPDPDHCVAQHIHGDVAECRMENPFLCLFVKSFGSGYMCWHPERRKFCQRYDAQITRRHTPPPPPAAAR
jgi:hypothetical protein